MKDLLSQYFQLQKEIFDYFGYKEDWKVIPLESCIEYYWHLTGESHGDEVKYAINKENLINGTKDDGYSSSIYTQRHLPKWVYRAERYTIVCGDTHCDGNKFLHVFDNEKEVKILAGPDKLDSCATYITKGQPGCK